MWLRSRSTRLIPRGNSLAAAARPGPGQRGFDHRALGIQLGRLGQLADLGQVREFVLGLDLKALVVLDLGAARARLVPGVLLTGLVGLFSGPRSPAPTGWAACSADHAAQPVGAGSSCTGTSEMQSTGHTGMHSSQPVHQGSITVCISLLAPKIASVGQALMHKVQPMHQASSMMATWRGPSVPCSGFKGSTGWPVRAAKRSMPAWPPGGHWLMGACPSAMARA